MTLTNIKNVNHQEHKNIKYVCGYALDKKGDIHKFCIPANCPNTQINDENTRIVTSEFYVYPTTINIKRFNQMK